MCGIWRLVVQTIVVAAHGITCVDRALVSMFLHQACVLHELFSVNQTELSQGSSRALRIQPEDSERISLALARKPTPQANLDSVSRSVPFARE